MSFEGDLNKFSAKVERMTDEVFLGVVDECHRSVVEGSEITGAPGQPVDTGVLKGSWIKSFTSPTEAIISTNVVYARPIEDGVGKYGPLTLRSKVGGWHSVALTIMGFERVVDYVTRKVKNAGL